MVFGKKNWLSRGYLTNCRGFPTTRNRNPCKSTYCDVVLSDDSKCNNCKSCCQRLITRLHHKRTTDTATVKKTSKRSRGSNPRVPVLPYKRVKSGRSYYQCSSRTARSNTHLHLRDALHRVKANDEAFEKEGLGVPTIALRNTLLDDDYGSGNREARLKREEMLKKTTEILMPREINSNPTFIKI